MLASVLVASCSSASKSSTDERLTVSASVLSVIGCWEAELTGPGVVTVYGCLPDVEGVNVRLSEMPLIHSIKPVALFLWVHHSFPVNEGNGYDVDVPWKQVAIERDVPPTCRLVVVRDPRGEIIGKFGLDVLGDRYGRKGPSSPGTPGPTKGCHHRHARYESAAKGPFGF